jgi:hypothetical protein
MKKTVLFLIAACLTFFASHIMIYAENVSYPFQSITITEATTFQVVIPENIQDTSLLYGLVEPGEIITVYMATIIFQEMNGEYNSSPSKVLILTNEHNEDIIRFVVNSAYHVIDVESYYSFASHILIDSSIGVYKNMDIINSNLGIQEITIHHVYDNNQLSFIDNQGLVITMIEGSYQHEPNLNIMISMNQGE